MKSASQMLIGIGKRYVSFGLTVVIGGILFIQRSVAAPAAVAGYTVSVFASAPQNFTGPDSITRVHKDIFVTYSNGAAKDGTSGSSVVVQYNLKGTVLHMYTIAGRNDGLKYNPYEETLWALRNEDGNPKLTIIDPETGTARDFTFYVSQPPHGGGYDDVAFLNGKAYLSASNPTLDINGQNNFPSVVSVKIVGDKVQVSPIFLGNAVLTNISTGAKMTSLQSDPDSLKVGPDETLFLTSQADGDLIFINAPGSKRQSARLLHLWDGTNIQVTVDDTVFPSRRTGTILVTDSGANKVYAITSSDFELDKAYAASDSDGAVGTVDLESGQFVPIIAGLNSPHGELFIPGRLQE